MKEIGHGSSPGKVSFPRTTFMKEIGHGSSPGKVSCLTTTFMKDFFIPVEPHEAVPEISKGKVHITQNKHVPIEWFVTTASQSRI